MRKAICEAMSRPHMRFVSVKTVEQQDIQAVHRIRAELTKQRTAKVNQIRGLVAEYGLVAPKEVVHLRRALPCWLDDGENGLSDRFRRLLNGLWGDLRALDERMIELDREIAVVAQSDPVAKRLQQLRGVGPIIATALVAAVGNGDQFANGRQMSAALGLTPKQHSSGGKERLLGISKRGDVYLRALLIHGARPGNEICEIYANNCNGARCATAAPGRSTTVAPPSVAFAPAYYENILPQ